MLEMEFGGQRSEEEEKGTCGSFHAQKLFDADCMHGDWLVGWLG
jgi:hypothetical protein